MTAGLRFDRYDWAGGREAMLRFGPERGPVVIVAMPLFEEANRTRAVVVAMLRALAERGLAGALPDLPGQGESLVPTEAATLLSLREAFAAAVASIAAEGCAVHVATTRSGALLDLFALASGRWHLSPQEGDDLLRELTRLKQLEVGRSRKLGDRWYLDGTLPEEAPDPPASIAGSLISPHLLSELTSAILHDGREVPKRVVRLDGDPRPADRHVPGAPPWRRAGPGRDDALALLLADEIAGWIAQCGG